MTRRRLSRKESLRRLGYSETCPVCGNKMTLGANTCRKCRQDRKDEVNKVTPQLWKNLYGIKEEGE